MLFSSRHPHFQMTPPALNPCLDNPAAGSMAFLLPFPAGGKWFLFPVSLAIAAVLSILAECSVFLEVDATVAFSVLVPLAVTFLATLLWVLVSDAVVFCLVMESSGRNCSFCRMSWYVRDPFTLSWMNLWGARNRAKDKENGKLGDEKDGRIWKRHSWDCRWCFWWEDSSKILETSQKAPNSRFQCRVLGDGRVVQGSSVDASNSEQTTLRWFPEVRVNFRMGKSFGRDCLHLVPTEPSLH